MSADERLRVEFRPPAPYSLQTSLGSPDLTRRRFPGGLELAYPTVAGPAYARVWQTVDGALHALIEAADHTAAHDRLGELCSVSLDHRPFLQMARDDRLLGPLYTRLRGLHPLLLGSTAHALVRGVTGQLIRSSEALQIERRIIARLSPRHHGLRLAPSFADLRAEHPARFQQAGLSPARAALLSRAAGLPWERIEDAASAAIHARLCELRGLGPWTAANVLLLGYGRRDFGLAGDLGLVRIASRLLGREADTADTQRLLEPYGEWQGLASLWLLHHPLARKQAPRVQLVHR